MIEYNANYILVWISIEIPFILTLSERMVGQADFSIFIILSHSFVFVIYACICLEQTMVKGQQQWVMVHSVHVYQCEWVDVLCVFLNVFRDSRYESGNLKETMIL